ncbi:MAG TPA: twin-arginine translocase TatA/TatE family subunit [Solirubrobacterales bacterium]|nr:twin-arginine translocase TatA/TatE family subunit [Solirubrobacterales bacterium]HMX72576.1 twin-arginine translocase TatA/TatE family subunit [Solirubrobacterales bacterium]HNA45516.1 twin-arginine translocase TatA/TatE family subunit [Solirubrobacterales bacterium]HNC93977.1 twin-arginine translocase TatA/TatE family subunit [Solirubrobacterales bacterium]HNE78882.1 twin-arginine translocase TatA/TatE family subunit [Solirubrobacterales bacterium]
MGFLPNIGPLELIIVLVIAVLILGPKRIPAAAKSVGQGMRNFKDSLGGGSEDEKKYEKSKSELDEKTETKA